MWWPSFASYVRPSVWNPGVALRNLIALAADGLQVYGVAAWHWDTFQILMLFWMETLVIGFWAMMRVGTLPAEQLGDITINGRVVSATHRMLLLLFAPLIVTIMAAHLLFLWVIFSGRWSEVVHGPVSFASEFIDKSGAWIPLLLIFVAGGIGYFRSVAFRRAASENMQTDGLGVALGAPFGRIALMQIAIIFGAMLSQKTGSMSPWLVLICLKTLLDYQQTPRTALGAGKTETE